MKKLRRASAVVMVLVALGVVGVVTSEIVSAALLYQQAAQDVARRRQAQVLAEAALERAILSLAASSDYRGEMWQPLVGRERSSSAVCEARIAIEIPNGDSSTHRITVLARMGESPIRLASHRLEITLPENVGETP